MTVERALFHLLGTAENGQFIVFTTRRALTRYLRITWSHEMAVRAAHDLPAGVIELKFTRLRDARAAANVITNISCYVAGRVGAPEFSAIATVCGKS